jgi:hypothetical protein
MSEQVEPKKRKYEGKVTELLALDKELWSKLKPLREPYGTVNEMFEDFIRILLGIAPMHPEILERLKEVVPLLSQEIN